MEWLTRGLLAIPVRSASIRFIDTPFNFYSTLLERIGRCEQRVLLSALYLGTGELEQRLVDAVRNRKNENQELSIGILLDYFRGTRQNECGQSSADFLRSLFVDCEVKWFFHPDMVGRVKKLLPKRLNEVVGLQHMKFFIFDDSILISGANLSEIYFTNRQDRYVLIENCPLLADLFAEIFKIIASYSLTLNKNGEIDYKRLENEDGEPHPLTGDIEALRKTIREKLEKLLADFELKIAAQSSSMSSFDTFIYPFLQMAAFDVNQEVNLLTRLFEDEKSKELDITISTGYFNLYEKYAELISSRRWQRPLQILFASPQANGFYNASGLAGNIPALYVHNSFEFLNRCAVAKAHDSVILAEYLRPNWTFHAKGVWINDKRTSPFTATIVGSSNFGYRSVSRDLEAQILLVTENKELSREINQERQSIAQHCNRLDLATFSACDHFVPIWVRYFSRIFRHFF